MSTQRLTRSSCRRILADKNGQQKVNLLTKKKKKATRSMMIKTPAILQPKSLSLDDIRRRLHPSVMPARLPCRDAQFENICNFIESTIRDCTSSSIYISGVPGTGKTATVMQAINYLQTDKVKKKQVPFTFISVNGMCLAEPAQVFVEIYCAMNGKKTRITPIKARKYLDLAFAELDRSPIVLLIDELDSLCTNRRQDILYTIFNWSTLPTARLVVIAIANTLDLPERLLSQRVSSRLGMRREIFEPYQFQEIINIINDRLSTTDDNRCIENDSIQLVSRKVASVSGDLRKSFDLLRRAVEFAIADKSKSLDLKHVQQVIVEYKSTIRSVMIRSLSAHSRQLLQAVIAVCESEGTDDVSFRSILVHYRVVCRAICKFEPLNGTAAFMQCMQMASCKLLHAAGDAGAMASCRFRLGMPIEDAQFMLKETTDNDDDCLS